MKAISKPVYIFLFAAATIVYVFGLSIDVMEIDAAQYASLSHEMLLTKNYFMLHFREVNYLDKPPLCFWLEALSYKVFGVNNFSYKLPSFIFTLIGSFATYKLTKRFYTEKIAWLAVLLLYTCQGFFLFNQDVRTDTILTGSVIFAIWQLTEYIETKKILSFILGFTAIAAAMLAKGPLGLMVPVIALSGHLIYKKRWKDFFKIEWIIGIIYVLLLLMPFLLGLFKQYGGYGLGFISGHKALGVSRVKVPGVIHPIIYFLSIHLSGPSPWAFLSIFAIAITLKSLFKRSENFDLQKC